jgi:hypothetical protein
MAGYQVTFTVTVQQLAAKFAVQVNIQSYSTDGSVCEITFLTMYIMMSDIVYCQTS